MAAKASAMMKLYKQQQQQHEGTAAAANGLRAEEEPVPSALLLDGSSSSSTTAVTAGAAIISTSSSSSSSGNVSRFPHPLHLHRRRRSSRSRSRSASRSRSNSISHHNNEEEDSGAENHPQQQKGKHFFGRKNNNKRNGKKNRGKQNGNASCSSHYCGGSSISSTGTAASAAGCGGGATMSSASPLRLRLPALVTPTDADAAATGAGSGCAGNHQHGGGGGGAKSFFRRVVSTPRSRALQQQQQPREEEVDTSFDAAVLGIRAPPSSSSSSSGGGGSNGNSNSCYEPRDKLLQQHPLYCVTPTYGGEEEEDDDDDYSFELDRDDGEDGVVGNHQKDDGLAVEAAAPLKNNGDKLSGNLAVAAATDSDPARGQTKKTGGKGKKAASAAPTRHSRRAGKKGERKKSSDKDGAVATTSTTSPRLGISRPSYDVVAAAAAAPGGLLEDDEIVFERDAAAASPGDVPRSIFEESWMSDGRDSSDDDADDDRDDDDDNDAAAGGEGRKRDKFDGEDNSNRPPESTRFHDTITCSPNGIEMTLYDEPASGTIPDDDHDGAVILPTSPSGESDASSPEKLIHVPTAEGQYLDEHLVDSLSPPASAAAPLGGIRYSLQSGKATTADGKTRISKGESKIMWTNTKANASKKAENATTSTTEQESSAGGGGGTANSSSSSSNPSTTIKIFVLLLQPDSKIFELIQLVYPVATTTIGNILDMIPKNATEPALAKQRYVAITRPKKKSPDYADRSLLASTATSRQKNKLGCKPNIGLVQGEIILAIPDAYHHSEIVRLGKKILANPRIQKLLEKSNPLSLPKKKSSRSSKGGKSNGKNNKSSSNRSLEKVVEGDEEEDSLLGASPRKKSSCWLAASQPGSLDAYLSDTAGSGRRYGDGEGNILWSPGSAASKSNSLIDAYLSDTTSRRRRSRNEKTAGPNPSTGMLEAYLSTPTRRRTSGGGSYTRNGYASHKVSESSANGSNNQCRQLPANALGHHQLAAGGDNASVGSHSTWSNLSSTAAASRQRPQLHRNGSASSFASLTSMPRSRRAPFSSATNTNNVAAFLAQRRERQLRLKKMWVSLAKLFAALIFTMAIRFYIDPKGHAAVKESRRSNNSIYSSDASSPSPGGGGDGQSFYDQSMGVIGAAQVLIFFCLLIKLQRTLEEGLRG